MDDFRWQIYNWYKLNKRELPWRKTNDPYKIWLSEIILQQTRVAQGNNYYLRFIEQFPTVFDLAAANEHEVLKLWQGLGYYSRARNLKTAANTIVNEYGGVFPTNFNDIKKLKGVGDYTAAAVASIAFNISKPAVDGNVYRVISRYYGIETPVDTAKGKNEIYEIANHLLPLKNAGFHNQALMEFGALQCIPKSPECSTCPVNSTCFAFTHKRVSSLPVKSKKTKISNRYFYFYYLNFKDFTFIEKRYDNDIWKNLYQFPLYESPLELTENQILKLSPAFLDKTVFNISKISETKKHILSHQNLFARLIEVEIVSLNHISLPFLKINKKDIFNFAFPKLMEWFIDRAKI